MGVARAESEDGLWWDGIVSLVYDTVRDPAGWADVFRRFNHVVGANAGGITMRSSSSIEQHWVGLPQEFNEAYLSHYHQSDPWVASGAQLLRVGECRNGLEFTPRAALARNDFYQVLCRQHDFVEICAAVVEKQDDLLVNIAFFTPTEAGLSGRQRDLVLRLLPHVRRATAIGIQMAQQRASLADLRMALDVAPFGVFRVDARGRVLARNRQGEALVSMENGLTERSGCLSAQCEEDAQALRRAIARSTGDTNDASDVPGPVMVHRPSGRPLTVFCVPSSEGDRGIGPRTATVFAIDPETDATPPASLLRQLYHLTAAEARLALLVGRGATLQEASNRLETSIHTTRTHLKRIFAKTETRRQSDLVLLLARLFVPGPQ